MHARVVLGVGKGVLFREVSSVKECPHRERGSTVNTVVHTVRTTYILIVQMVSVRVRWEEVERRLKHQTDQYEDSSSKFISFLTRFTGFCNWLSEIHDQLLELCESVPHMASPETIALHTAKLEVLEHCFWICVFVCVCLCI